MNAAKCSAGKTKKVNRGAFTKVRLEYQNNILHRHSVSKESWAVMEVEQLRDLRHGIICVHTVAHNKTSDRPLPPRKSCESFLLILCVLGYNDGSG